MGEAAQEITEAHKRYVADRRATERYNQPNLALP